MQPKCLIEVRRLGKRLLSDAIRHTFKQPRTIQVRHKSVIRTSVRLQLGISYKVCKQFSNYCSFVVQVLHSLLSHKHPETHSDKYTKGLRLRLVTICNHKLFLSLLIRLSVLHFYQSNTLAARLTNGWRSSMHSPHV